jgi:hypothetical protein
MFLKVFLIKSLFWCQSAICFYIIKRGRRFAQPQNQGQGRTLNGFNPPAPEGGEGQTISYRHQKRCSGIALKRSVTRFKPF